MFLKNVNLNFKYTMNMKQKLFNLFLIPLFFLSSCTIGQEGNTKVNLGATEFAEKMKAVPAAPIIDVRTPEEFKQGHIQNAVNINWNGSDFSAQMEKFDKSKPIFIYCLSGGRSSSASAQLKSEGFKEIYELTGGMMAWRSAKMPETKKDAVVNAGMTMKQYKSLLETDKLVLIDFYAVWCAPCKRMKPFLDEMSVEMKEKLEIIRIDSDLNPELAAELKVEGLPTLLLYKKGELVWNHLGYIEKVDLVKQIEVVK